MTPLDKLLIVALLLLSLASYSLIKASFPHSPDRTAVVEIEGKEVMRLSLSPNLPDRKVPVRFEKGTAFLDISKGKIRMLPMPDDLCPKHICSRRGWIESRWEMIVCMPNRISVRILSDEEKEAVDLVTR